MGEGDEETLGWVREFNPFDLYSKTEEVVDVEKLKVSVVQPLELMGGTC